MFRNKSDGFKVGDRFITIGRETHNWEIELVACAFAAARQHVDPTDLLVRRIDEPGNVPPGGRARNGELSFRTNLAAQPSGRITRQPALMSRSLAQMSRARSSLTGPA